MIAMHGINNVTFYNNYYIRYIRYVFKYLMIAMPLQVDGILTEDVNNCYEFCEDLKRDKTPS